MRKRDCEMLLVLEMEGTAILTSGIIFTKSDKTQKKKRNSKFYIFFSTGNLLLSLYTLSDFWMWEPPFRKQCENFFSFWIAKQMRLSRDFLHILELFINDHCIAPKTINITHSHARHIHANVWWKYHEFLSTVTHQAYLKTLIHRGVPSNWKD